MRHGFVILFTCICRFTVLERYYFINDFGEIMETNTDDRKMNIGELLSALEKADDGIDDYVAMQDDFVNLTSEKIDSYYYVQNKQSSRIAELKSEADKLRSKAKTIENERKRMLEFLRYSMDKTGTSSFPGKTYNVKVISRKKWQAIRPALLDDYIKTPKYIEVKTSYIGEPTGEIIDTLRKAGLSDIFDTHFCWKEKTIKNELKNDAPDEFCESITKYDVSSYVKFDVRKVEA